ncbi:MAG: hypothetical protein KKE23_03110 [Nanoarchaeota archaeon]|nr:hypothetical protein [Nanoarchaeota archaeon]
MHCRNKFVGKAFFSVMILFFVFMVLSFVCAAPSFPLQVYGGLSYATPGNSIPNYYNISFNVGSLEIGNGVIYNNGYGYDPIILLNRDDSSTIPKEGYSLGDNVDVYIQGLKVAENKTLNDDRAYTGINLLISDVLYSQIMNITPPVTNYTINSSDTLVGDSISLLILPSNVQPQKIVIPSSIPEGNDILMDISAKMGAGGSFVPSTSDLSIVRTVSGKNYSLFIPANSIISGSASTTTLLLPTIRSNSVCSVSGGAINKVIDVGFSSDLNSSKPLKITFGGMSGNKAGWTKTTGAITTIGTVCNNAVNPTNLNYSTVRECYADSGSDMVVWTYHTTKYAAYTLTTVTDDTTNGGGTGETGRTGGTGTTVTPTNTTSTGGTTCTPNWQCYEWDECMDGLQSRVCKDTLCGLQDKAETQYCSTTEPDVGNLTKYLVITISVILFVALIGFLIILYLKRQKISAPIAGKSKDILVLKDYILKSRELKYEDTYIRTLLKNNNWSEDLINQAFKELK